MDLSQVTPHQRMSAAIISHALRFRLCPATPSCRRIAFADDAFRNANDIASETKEIDSRLE
jgi:hypothetical protein